LSSARQVGPLKGFPLRVDFLQARLHRDRIFAVGEAAGLVNPLTGEGIDYALESGQLAAQYLARALEQRGFDAETCAGYTELFHQRFRAQFRFLIYVARILITRPMLNRAVKAAIVQPSYKEFLIDIALGNRRASPLSSVYMLARLGLSSFIWS
jgi:flavin-dependent dehydrogenase